MKTTILFPHGCKKIGWLLFVPGLAIGLLALLIDDSILHLRANVLAVIGSGLTTDAGWFRWLETDMTITLAGTLFIIGGLLIAFSKEKKEDEFVAQIRLSSFQWAVFTNYVLLLLAFLAVYGKEFLVILPFLMFTVILLFIARFHYLLHKNYKYLNHEE